MKGIDVVKLVRRRADGRGRNSKSNEHRDKQCPGNINFTVRHKAPELSRSPNLLPEDKNKNRQQQCDTDNRCRKLLLLGRHRYPRNTQ